MHTAGRLVNTHTKTFMYVWSLLSTLISNAFRRCRPHSLTPPLQPFLSPLACVAAPTRARAGRHAHRQMPLQRPPLLCPRPPLLCPRPPLLCPRPSDAIAPAHLRAQVECILGVAIQGGAAFWPGHPFRGSLDLGCSLCGPLFAVFFF